MADHKKIIPFIIKEEGGLSRAKTDSASQNPSPYVIRARDISLPGAPFVTASDWHTNKGVTWETFTSLAPKLGYQINAQNWTKMPSDIWGKIFKNGYWDKLKLDQVNNQAIANVAADFAWGAGPFRAAQRLQMAVNRLRPNTLTVDGNIGPRSIAAINSANQSELFRVYSAMKDSFYKGLKNQSANQKGWSDRHERLIALSKKYLPAIGTTLLLFSGVFFWAITT